MMEEISEEPSAVLGSIVDKALITSARATGSLIILNICHGLLFNNFLSSASFSLEKKRSIKALGLNLTEKWLKIEVHKEC